MTERDRLSLKAWREEERQRELREEEARMRPVREAEEKLADSYRALAKMERTYLLGEMADPERFIDDTVATIRLTPEQANTFNAHEIQIYRQVHPEVYWCGELVSLLGTYFDKNGIRIVTASMIEKLVDRMHDVSLLPERPEPEPDPEHPIEQPEPVAPQPEVFQGWDVLTGEPKSFSKYQVDRMDSETFRRTFRVRRPQTILAG